MLDSPNLGIHRVMNTRMLRHLVLCIALAAIIWYTLGGGAAGGVGASFAALLMLGCCILPMVLLLGGKSGHDCSSGQDKEKKDQKRGAGSCH